MNKPEQSESENPRRHVRKTRKTSKLKKKKAVLPSVDELLHKLLQLNGAVALGTVSTKDANLLHKNYKTVLDVQLKRSNGESPIRDEQSLMEACRANPALLNTLEAFLTDEQLRQLMKELTGEGDE